MTREEAIEKVREMKLSPGKDAELIIALHTLIPELRESEDERIRKGLIEALKTSKTVGELKFILPEPTRKECIAYLEKQKEPENVSATTMAPSCWAEEQKPAEWSEEDKENLLCVCGLLKHYLSANYKGSKYWDDAQVDELLEWTKNLPNRFQIQPKQEWSEEDDQLIGFIFDLLNDLVWRKDWAMSKEECLERLKSLRPRWNPSEEQMEALNALNCHGDLSYVGQQSQLISLYNDLKKLI